MATKYIKNKQEGKIFLQQPKLNSTNFVWNQIYTHCKNVSFLPQILLEIKKNKFTNQNQIRKLITNCRNNYFTV